MEAVLGQGIVVRYNVLGSGPPLLCIMGLGASKELWGESFLAGLAQQYKVITYDNRGVGGSVGPRPVTMEGFASDAVGLLKHLGIARAHVLGISMGGMIAQQIAVDHPEMVDKLVLGCTSCASKHIRFNPGLLGLLIFRVAPRFAFRALVSSEFIARHRDKIKAFTSSMLRASTPQETTLEQLRACKSFDLETRVTSIKAPTLLITGTGDRVINWQNSELLARQIPGAKLLAFPGVGHVFPLEREQETVRAMREFLA